ncbi:type II secretion system protein [Massilicoli timonensis]|uniref:type II secretion system protein n=1 Tax=Massilicoli timonensis TaxID=2015901 RepID=UPI0023F27B12|nr:type II secretion system protein [Massilicoli timonensis]
MIYKRCMKRSAFTMSEMILALLIVSLCALVLAKSMSVLRYGTKASMLLSDEMALWQMRRLLAQAEDITWEKQVLHFLYHDEEGALRIKKDQIVHQIGNEIMMMELDDAYFYEEDGCVWLSWKREKEDYQGMLYCPA